MGTPSVRGAVGLLAAVALTATLAACGEGETVVPPDPQANGEPERVQLRVGVFGTGSELEAYNTIADRYSNEHEGIEVKVQAWADEPEMIADVTSGGDVPDLFLTGRADLDELIENKAVQPVDEALDARGVALGGNYSRTALEHFSVDRRLQCMPYGSNPTVAYVNTDLIDLESLPEKYDLDVPDPESGRWDLEQFDAALQNAVAGKKKGQPVAGVYVSPTISGLAPWLEAAGGQTLDDPGEPTSLTLSDSQDALEELLPILNDPEYRLTDAELGGETPLQRFSDGRLAVLTGDRTLVPPLRQVKGLNWDVRHLPGDGGATTGDYTGMCLSSGSEHPQLAADLLAYLNSEDAVAEVTKAGYLLPANQRVGWSEAFNDTSKPPSRPAVFIDAVRNMRVMPPRSVTRQLDSVTGEDVRSLFGEAWRNRLENVTERIDAASVAVLAPEQAEEESDQPGATPTSGG